MDKFKAEHIKTELKDCLESQDYGCLSEDSVKDILSLLNRLYPKIEPKQDTTPMIGTNPFKKTTNNTSDVTPNVKDFNKSLNYRVSKFEDYPDEEN